MIRIAMIILILSTASTAAADTEIIFDGDTYSWKCLIVKSPIEDSYIMYFWTVSDRTRTKFLTVDDLNIIESIQSQSNKGISPIGFTISDTTGNMASIIYGAENKFDTIYMPSLFALAGVICGAIFTRAITPA